MKKNKLILLFVLMFLLISTNSLAKNQYLGSYNIKDNNYLNINEKNYFSVTKIAELLESEFSWKIEKEFIIIDFKNIKIKSDDYNFVNNRLYLPENVYKKELNLDFAIENNKYYVYKINKINFNYKEEFINVLVQTNKKYYNYNESIGVSLLLINSENIFLNKDSIKYDLILFNKEKNKEIWRLSSDYIFDNKDINFDLIKAKDFVLETLIINIKGNDISNGKYKLIIESLDNRISLSGEKELFIIK